MKKFFIPSIKILSIHLLIILSIFMSAESLLNNRYLNKALSSFIESKLEKIFNIKLDIQQLKIDIRNFKISIPQICSSSQENFVVFQANDVVLKINSYDFYKKRLLVEEMIINTLFINNNHEQKFWNVISQYHFKKEKKFLNFLSIDKFEVKNILMKDSSIFHTVKLNIDKLFYNIKEQSGKLHLHIANNKQIGKNKFENLCNFQAELEKNFFKITNLEINNNNLQIYDSNIYTNFKEIDANIYYKNSVDEKIYNILEKFFHISNNFKKSKKIQGTLNANMKINEILNTNIKISVDNILNNESIKFELDSSIDKKNSDSYQKLKINNIKSNIWDFCEESFLEFDLQNLQNKNFLIKVINQDLAKLQSNLFSGNVSFFLQSEENLKNINSKIQFTNLTINYSLEQSELKRMFIEEISKIELIKQLLYDSNIQENNVYYSDELSIFIKSRNDNLQTYWKLLNLHHMDSKLINHLIITTNHKNNISHIKMLNSNKILLETSLDIYANNEFLVINQISGMYKNKKFHLRKPLKWNKESKSILSGSSLLFNSGELSIFENKTLLKEDKCYSILLQISNLKTNNVEKNVFFKNTIKINTQNLVFSLLQDLIINTSEKNKFEFKMRNDISNTQIESNISFKENDQPMSQFNFQLPIYVDIQNSKFLIEEEKNFLITLNSENIKLEKLLFLVPKLRKIEGNFKGHFKIYGTLNNKNVKCNFEVKNIQYKTPNSNSINLYRADLSVQDINNKVLLKDIIVRSNDGTYCIGEGQLITSPKIGYEIHFTTNKFSVLGHTFHGQVRGDVTLSGNIDHSRVTGTVYSINTTLDLEKQNIKNSALEYLNIKNFTPQNQKKILNKKNKKNRYQLYLDLLTISQKSLLIKTQEIRSITSGKIQISGSVGYAIFSGTLDSNEGYYSTYGKKFRIHSAYIVLNKNISRSYVNMFCITRKDSYDIHIHITGRIYLPNVSFTSVPELKEEEIISLIALGTTKYNPQLDTVLLSANLGSLIKNYQLEEKSIIIDLLQKIDLSLHMSLLEKFFLPFSISLPIKNNLLLEYRNFNTQYNKYNSQEDYISMRYFYEF